MKRTKSLPITGEGVRRGTSLAQCVGDYSRLTDEVFSEATGTIAPHPSRANGLGHSLRLCSARPTFPSKGRLLVRDVKRTNKTNVTIQSFPYFEWMGKREYRVQSTVIIVAKSVI